MNQCRINVANSQTPRAPGASLRRNLDGRRGLMLERLVSMALHAILVSHDLAIELVDHEIDGGIHVAIAALNEDVLAFQMKVHFNLLSLVLFLVVVDREDHIAIDDLIEMS
ncbi:hypothetical protein PT2222_10474 [Paraburkholderia tropica]